MSPLYWLMKSEPDVFSIQHLAQKKRAPWDGVRNFQARNFMRDKMTVGDKILFYHSSANPPGVAGLARVASAPYPDATQWNKASEYFDPRASQEKPVWFLVDVEFEEIFPHFVSLDELRSTPALEGLMVIRRGMRLSIQPVSPEHFIVIQKLGHQSPSFISK